MCRLTGVVTVDGDARIESANPAAGRIFGTSPEQLQGHPFAQLFADPSQAQALLARARDAASATAGQPMDTAEGQRRDGAQFPLECTVSPVALHGQALSVAMLRDISVRKELEAQLSRLAQYDALTGLPNRALFMDRLATAALRAGRARKPLAVLFLDLDGFKAINDEFGHREGDAVLVETARRLRQAVRKSDTVARLGGDEFTILVEQLSEPLDDVRSIAEKIGQAMRMPFPVQGRQPQITVSIGAAVHAESDTPPDTAALHNRADDAMYEAKRGGKNDYRVAVLEARRG